MSNVDDDDREQKVFKYFHLLVITTYVPTFQEKMREKQVYYCIFFRVLLGKYLYAYAVLLHSILQYSGIRENSAFQPVISNQCNA